MPSSDSDSTMLDIHLRVGTVYHVSVLMIYVPDPYTTLYAIRANDMEETCVQYESSSTSGSQAHL